MDTEIQSSPPHEYVSKIVESSSDPPGETATNGKDGPKTPTKTLTTKTRSRSRTPQKKKDKKNEDNSKLHLKKIDESVNGQEEKQTRGGEKKNRTVEETVDNLKNSVPKDDSVKNDEDTKEAKKHSKAAKEPVKEINSKDSKQPLKISKEPGASNSETSTKEAKNSPKVPKESGVNNADTKTNDTKKSSKISKEIDINKGETHVKETKKSSKTPKEIGGNKEEAHTKESSRTSKEPEHSTEIIAKSSVNDRVIEIVEFEVPTKTNEHVTKLECEGVDMDPLVLAVDEPDPELQFDENSDMDSGKGSPIQTRCRTRRSQTRYIPTPKTPKTLTDSESEKNSVAPTPTPENLNDTAESVNIDDISTRAEVGSDSHRLDYLSSNTSMFSEDDTYLNYSRDRSLGETLRGLSSRKTIRPLNDSYRQKAFRNTQTKADLNHSPYPDRDSIDRIVGAKRKRSVTPEQRKRQRSESTGFVSYLSSPLSNFKSRFVADISSSTPKLTGYKDSSKNIHEEMMYSEVVSDESEKKNWCSLM